MGTNRPATNIDHDDYSLVPILELTDLVCYNDGLVVPDQKLFVTYAYQPAQLTQMAEYIAPDSIRSVSSFST